MPERDRNRKRARAAVCAVFGVFLVVAGGGAVAYAEDDDDALPDEKFMRSFLRAMGLRNGQEAGIEYRERPPLVLPPTTNLPPPGSATSLAKRTPQWPDDPDIKRAKAAAKAKAEKKPIDWVADVDHDRMTPQESNVGRTSSQTADAPQRAGASQAGGGNAELTVQELGYKPTFWENIYTFGGIFKTEKVESKVFVREPSRSVLTDPPSGYRTPSPNQPYGINEKDNGVGAKGQQDPQTVRGN
jgi:hypothetical protein